MLSKYKNIILVLVISAAGFFVYNQFFQKTPSTDLISSQSKNKEKNISEQITADIQRIKDISLDKKSIFENRVFRSLEDKGVQIEPQEAGRSNPFAPLFSKDIQNSVNNTTKTQASTSSATNTKSLTGN